MKRMYYFQLLILTAIAVVTEAASDSDMRQLLDHLLNSTEYSSRVRPIKDTGNILSVSRVCFCLILRLSNRVLSEVSTSEPPRDKTNKMTVRPAKTQISLGVRPV